MGWGEPQQPVPFHPNRRTRRDAMKAEHRPKHDLMLTGFLGAVYIGLRGSGSVRLNPGEARQVLEELTELVRQADAPVPD